MGKAQREAQAAEQPVEVQPVGDEAATIYGLTLGEIVKDRDGIWTQLVEAKKAIASQEAALLQKNAVLLTQSARIESLEADAKKHHASAQPNQKPTMEQVAAALTKSARAAGSGLTILADGSIQMLITIPVDAATPLLSWAEIAGEDPATYIQKNVEEALLAFTSS